MAEIQRDEARKQLTITRAKALDQAWQDRKAELALEQAHDRKAILGLAQAASSSATGASETKQEAAVHEDDDATKSAARKQIEEREASRKGKGFHKDIHGHTDMKKRTRNEYKSTYCSIVLDE